MNSSPILVCFAVKEEVRSIGRPKETAEWKVLLTGMGKKNAEISIRKAIVEIKPQLVITAGFAGGLNPALKLGTVVFDEDIEAGFAYKLSSLGAHPAKFHCAGQVAVTSAEKQSLYQSTGADAVEMESAVIRAICREHKIPSATIRVISDVANEDLPLDFNALMTADHRINFLKLAGKLICSPQKIPQLMKFRKQTSFAANELGRVLSGLLVK